MRRDLRSDLVFSTYLGTTSNPVAEAATDHAERCFSMIPLAVQSSSSVRPVLPERDHLLIVRLRSSEVSSVLLDAVERRRTMLPGRCQADLPMVCGVGQRTSRRNVLRQSVPDVREHLAVVHVRAR